MRAIPKKILICEDHQIVIDGLLSIFQTQEKYLVIDCLKNGNEVLPFVKNNLPDILLLDLNLPYKNGLEILKEVKPLFSELKVIILTMYNKESIAKEVKRNKGDGFLLKNCSSSDLFDALDSVFRSNKFYLGKGVKISSEDTDDFLKEIKITRREKEVIRELVNGLNVPKIAEKLFISPLTVETHKKNIFKKLGIHNSIDLLKFVNENEMLS